MKIFYIEHKPSESTEQPQIYVPVFSDVDINLDDVQRIQQELYTGRHTSVILAICDSNLSVLYYEFNELKSDEL